MDTYFERLEEIVKRHEDEVNHLNEEREALRNEQNNMPIEEFNNEYQRLIFHLENETNSLNEARNTLQTYRTNYEKSFSLIRDLRSLRDELANRRDSQDEKDITEEIERKEEELHNAITSLPLELADYVRNSFLRENTNVNTNRNTNANTSTNTVPSDIVTSDTAKEPVGEEIKPRVNATLLPDAQEEYDKISASIEALRKEQSENDKLIQDIINRINEIIAEERAKYEQEGPFDNETLKSLQDYYMGLKMSENEMLITTRKKQERLARKLRQLEKQQNRIVEINNSAVAFDISYNEMKELASTLNNRKIINKILEQKGLGDIIHKSSRTKAEKEQLKNALEEIKKEIIAYQKENGKSDEKGSIEDAIRALYGMDDKVKKVEDPKVMKVPEETHLAVIENAKQLPAVIRDFDFTKKNNQDSTAVDLYKNAPLLPDLHMQDENKKNATPLKEEDKEDDDKKKAIPIKEENKEEKHDNNKKEPEAYRPKRGLREIIGDLRKDLTIGKKDGQRYRRSNLKVSQNFKKELQSGNTLYNIVHVVPAVVKASTQLLGKMAGKIMLGKEAKEMMHTLEERIDNLRYVDLETIFKEYRGNRINQERYPQALNMVIEEKMSEFVLGKVTKLNENIEKNYKNVFYSDNLIRSIDDNLRKGKLSNEEKLSRLEEKKALLEKAAESIKYIREAKIEADNLLSGGLHGLSEDMKAAASKLNCVGMRFAKSYDLDQELEDKLMKAEKAENQAIYDGDNEKLLNAFIESELLLSSNTEINYSIFGKRSTGKKYYSPLAEQLDYRNDPFIRDLFTTIAVTASAVSAANAANGFKHQNEQANELLINEKEILDKVHKAGEDITSKRGAIYEGMKAQANKDVLTSAGSIERANLDANGWVIGSDTYHAADAAGHEFFNNFYNEVQGRFADVSQAYSSGALNQAGVIEELAKISSDSHFMLGAVANKCLEVLRPYAQNNPQFDLSAVQETMEYIVSHPDAVSNMNQAIVDIQNIGDELVNLSGSQIEAISSLPGNLGPTLISAASACALASRVSNEMNTKKKRYGNSVTDMVSEYIDNYNLEDEEENKNVR